MYHVTEELSSFNGGGFGKRFNLHLDTGPTYQEIILKTNVNNDQVERVVLSLNGDPIVDATGEQLRMLEAYKGNHQEDGCFVIPLAHFDAKLEEAQNLPGLVTLNGDTGIDNIVLEVYIGAATAQQVTDGLIPTMQGVAVMAPAQAARLFIKRIYSELIQAGATGVNKYRNFSRGPRIQRLHLNADVTRLEIVRDRLSRFDLAKSDNDLLLKRAGMVPQTDYYHFDPLLYGFHKRDMLQTAGNMFEINPTMGTAGDFEALFETLEVVGVAA